MKILKIFFVLIFVGFLEAFMITGKMNKKIQQNKNQFMNDYKNLKQLSKKDLKVEITPRNYKFQNPTMQKTKQNKQKFRKLENDLQEPQDEQAYSSNPFTDNVSNLDGIKTQQQPSQNNEQAKTGNKELDSMIQKALIATNYKSPIIVINHAPKIHYKSIINNQTQYTDNTPISQNAQTFEDTYAQFKDDQLLNKQPMVLKKWQDPNPGKVNFMELTTLIDISNSVWEYYDTYFKKVPKTNGQQSGLDQAVDALRFYKDTKELVQMVFNEREQLKEDLYYLDMKINLMQSDRFFMVEFYGFSYKYKKMQDSLQNLSQEIKNRINQDLEIENQRLDNIASQFQTDVNTLHAKIYELQKLNGFFEREITEIQSADNENEIANALEKFDRILMLTLRILEMKVTIEEAIQQIREKTQNLSTYRSQVESVILDMSQIEQKVKHREQLEKQRDEKEAEKAENQQKYLQLLGTVSLTFQNKFVNYYIIYNMTEEEEFPHFTNLLHCIQQNLPVEITDEVNNEIIKLITGYEENKNQKNKDEFKKLIGMLENYEKEHEMLKGDLKRKNTQFEKTEKIKLNLEQIIQENENQIKRLTLEHDNKIHELNDQINHLKKDNDFMNKKLKQYSKEVIKSQQEFQEEASNANELEIENISLKNKIEKLNDELQQKTNTLTQALEDKKKECDNLRLNLKQTTQKSQKQKSTIMFLKQQSKADEQIIRNQKKEINENKEQLNIYKESSEKRFEKDDQMILKLIDMIQNKEFKQKNLEDLIQKFDKRKLIFQISNPQAQKLSARAIDKIKEYEMENFDESHLDFEPESNNISFQPNETQQTIRLSTDNQYLSQFKMDDSINLETPQKKRILEDLQIESEQKIQKTKQNILSKSKQEISCLKKKFEMDLDKQINLKRNSTLKSLKSPLTISNPINFGSQLCFQKVEHKQDETIKHNYAKQKENYLDNLEIPEKEFEWGLIMLEEICNNPDKNPTTFIIQDFDKRQLRSKFQKSKKKNLRRYINLFIKLFLYQINYLEGKISTLTYNNSCLDLSLQNKKDELNFLLSEFLKKNAQNQDQLNKINSNLMNMRKKNKKKLKQYKNQKFDVLVKFTDNSSFQDESINKNKLSSQNNTSIFSQTKFTQKSKLNKSKKILSEEQASIQNSKQESDQIETDSKTNNDSNFFSKITSIFNQFKDPIMKYLLIKFTFLIFFYLNNKLISNFFNNLQCKLLKKHILEYSLQYFYYQFYKLYLYILEIHKINIKVLLQIEYIFGYILPIFWQQVLLFGQKNIQFQVYLKRLITVIQLYSLLIYLKQNKKNINENEMKDICNEIIQDSVIEVSFIYNLQDFNNYKEQLENYKKDKLEHKEEDRQNGIDIAISKIESELELIKQDFNNNPLKRFTGVGFLTFRNINYALLFRNLYLKSQGKSLNDLKKKRVKKNMQLFKKVVRKLQIDKQLRKELIDLDKIDTNVDQIQKRRESFDMNTKKSNNNKYDFSTISNILYKQEIRDMDKEKIDLMRFKLGKDFRIFQVTDINNLNFNFKKIRNYSNLELGLLFLLFVIILPYLAYVFNFGYFYHELIFVNSKKFLIGQFIIKMIYLILAVGLDIVTLEIISRIFNKNNFIDISLMYQYKLFSSIFYLMLTNIILPNIGLKDALTEFIDENNQEKNHFQVTHLTSVVDFTIKLFLFSNFNQKFFIPYFKEKFLKQKIQRNIIDEMIFNIIFIVNSIFWISHFCTIRQNIGILFLVVYFIFIGLDFQFVLKKCSKDNNILPITIISNSIVILTAGIYPACLIGYYSITQYFDHILNPSIYKTSLLKNLINYILGFQINFLKLFYFLDGQNNQTPRILLFKLINYFRSFALETTYLLFTDLRFIITTVLYAVVIIYFVQEFAHMRFLDRLQLKTKNSQDLKMNQNIEGKTFRSANPAYQLLSKEKIQEIEEDMKKYK